MPRLITINAVKIKTWGQSDDGAYEVATYEVGTSDGTAFTAIPSAATQTTAQVVIADTSTKADTKAALAAAIFQQEGLTVGSDFIFRPNGVLV